jgi:GxxExxY protein
MEKDGNGILFKEESYRIIGMCMKIHNTLGKGFKEVVYKDALELELYRGKIKYKREAGFVIEYEGARLQHFFIADFLITDCMILEIKSTPFLQAWHFAQTLNYLKASHLKLGILINFGEQRLNYKRIICP